eukprot:TRINITY_DN18291_c0_g1_i1.p1 TRINITY_DN18291_c0_g1~~TRINITY_DN18291_c0_g1_i1.p1  ORF type:complete len:381 (+),score=95.71 TRINITY_DN18291_c0_g1_i1:23-1165(+)
MGSSSSWLVAALFALLGVGELLPWQVFLGSIDHFAVAFPSHAFGVALSVAYNVPGLPAVFLNMWIGPKIPFAARLVGLLVVNMLGLALIPVVMHFASLETAYTLLLALVSITSVSSTMAFGTVTALGSLVPGRNNVVSAMTGNGIAGLLASCLRIAIKQIAADATLGCYIYFAVSAGVMLVCITAAMMLMRLDITRKALDKVARTRKTAGTPRSQKQQQPLPARTYRDAAVVFVVFFVTLAVFPGLVTMIPSQTPEQQDWFRVQLVAVLTVGDFIGRGLPYALRLPRGLLEITSYARLALVPAFVICARGLITSDAAAYTLVLLLAVSGGYCGTLGVTYGPEAVPTELKERAGFLMGLFLMAGVLASSPAALGLLYITAT